MVISGYQLKTVLVYWRAFHANSIAHNFQQNITESRTRLLDARFWLDEYEQQVHVRPDRENAEETYSLAYARRFLRALRQEDTGLYAIDNDFDTRVRRGTRIAHAVGAIADGYTVKLTLDIPTEIMEIT